MPISLTDAHHAWVAATLGVDPRLAETHRGPAGRTREAETGEADRKTVELLKGGVDALKFDAEVGLPPGEATEVAVAGLSVIKAGLAVTTALNETDPTLQRAARWDAVTSTADAGIKVMKVAELAGDLPDGVGAATSIAGDLMKAHDATDPAMKLTYTIAAATKADVAALAFMLDQPELADKLVDATGIVVEQGQKLAGVLVDPVAEAYAALTTDAHNTVSPVARNPAKHPPFAPTSVSAGPGVTVPGPR